jgi:hypothetical protein
MACWKCGKSGHKKSNCPQGRQDVSDEPVDELASAFAALDTGRAALDAGRLTAEVLADPVETGGSWVLRIDFPYTHDRSKSFGAFECACGKIWCSAHAYYNYKQACKSCNTYYYAKFMWLNDRSE